MLDETPHWAWTRKMVTRWLVQLADDPRLSGDCMRIGVSIGIRRTDHTTGIGRVEEAVLGRELHLSEIAVRQAMNDLALAGHIDIIERESGAPTRFKPLLTERKYWKLDANAVPWHKQPPQRRRSQKRQEAEEQSSPPDVTAAPTSG